MNASEDFISNKRSFALITGASKRVGKAIAQAVAAQDYVIGLHYFRGENAAREMAFELQESGVSVELLQADLRDSQAIEAMFTRISELPYHFRLLVNSAAVMKQADLINLDVKEWDDTFSLNLRAPWMCSKYAVRMMQVSNGGLIINITDSGSLKAWSSFPAYIVSKAALESLTRVMARAFAPGVRVNAIAPGLVIPSINMDTGEWERLIKRVPLKRSAFPSEIGQAVSFLIQNEYVTGQTIVVDGGYQLLG